jgi:hypothetical protein
VVLVALWSVCGVVAVLLVSVLVVDVVLEVEDCVALVSVEGVLDAGALVLGAVDAAPLWALSFAAVPVVEVAGAPVLGVVVSAGVVEVAGA